MIFLSRIFLSRFCQQENAGQEYMGNFVRGLSGLPEMRGQT
jgi:hypothetical protein